MSIAGATTDITMTMATFPNSIHSIWGVIVGIRKKKETVKVDTANYRLS